MNTYIATRGSMDQLAHPSARATVLYRCGSFQQEILPARMHPFPLNDFMFMTHWYMNCTPSR